MKRSTGPKRRMLGFLGSSARIESRAIGRLLSPNSSDYSIMVLSKPLRSLSTAARIFRDEGSLGVIRTIASKAIGVKKRRDLDAIMQHETLRDRFTEINKRGLWYTLTNWESRSGVGSTRTFTRPYVDDLCSFLDEIRCEKRDGIIFFDAPCGDFNWIQPVTMRDDLYYIGADIVPSIVAENNRRHGSAAVQFMEFDITADRFPDATIWHCRDCLIHLSFSNIIRSFENFACSNIDYALLTCFHLPENHVNHDIADGDFRALDFRKTPFVLPPPIRTIPDSTQRAPRFTYVYTRDQIAEWLA